MGLNDKLQHRRCIGPAISRIGHEAVTSIKTLWFIVDELVRGDGELWVVKEKRIHAGPYVGDGIERMVSYVVNVKHVTTDDDGLTTEVWGVEQLHTVGGGTDRGDDTFEEVQVGDDGLVGFLEVLLDCFERPEGLFSNPAKDTGQITLNLLVKVLVTAWVQRDVDLVVHHKSTTEQSSGDQLRDIPSLGPRPIGFERPQDDPPQNRAIEGATIYRFRKLGV